MVYLAKKAWLCIAWIISTNLQWISMFLHGVNRPCLKSTCNLPLSRPLDESILMQLHLEPHHTDHIDWAKDGCLAQKLSRWRLENSSAQHEFLIQIKNWQELLYLLVEMFVLRIEEDTYEREKAVDRIHEWHGIAASSFMMQKEDKSIMYVCL